MNFHDGESIVYRNCLSKNYYPQDKALLSKNVAG